MIRLQAEWLLELPKSNCADRFRGYELHATTSDSLANYLCLREEEGW
jgi:hypothetical protein